MKIADHPLFSWREDPRVPDFDDQGPRTVMDATCALCARGAIWIAHQDRAAEFRIIPAQSELGIALLRHFELDPGDPASWLFLDGGRAHTSLDAMIRAGRQLGRWNHALAALMVLPRPLQDWLYARIARNRYRLMGRADLCKLPDADVQARLLR